MKRSLREHFQSLGERTRSKSPRDRSGDRCSQRITSQVGADNLDVDVGIEREILVFERRHYLRPML